ncbi:potassium transporter TrkA [Streptomyces luteoverticillatus]|uniref:Potassium transporter TrkA n=1 Tax=Streptomyces luteoverticillatus TaxID=66425 RepID=A0A3Q9G1X1_STRLT|nr:NAD(P)-binding protein [Streptomyces luteoverticillatus]AZQ75763.1 potassium transporter TrkA [Streptomyces luteoverticillatus]
MVVCGDDGLAHRLTAELSGVHGERVVLVLPPAGEDRRRPVAVAGRAAALFGRVTGAVGRGPNGPNGASGTGGSSGPNSSSSQNGSPGGPVRVVEAAEPDDEALTQAGVERAVALALVYEDDETNVNAAMRARRLNPRLRLVIRLYNRRLGQYLEELLDQAALVGDADAGTTTVLSDADTAAPALVAAAVTGTSKAIEAGDLMLRAVERPAPAPGPEGDDAGPGTVTLALLSDGDGPVLLPDERQVARAGRRGRVVLETVRFAAPPPPPSSRFAAARSLPLGSFFSRRLRWALVGLAAAVCGLAVASWLVTGDAPVHAAYLSLLDLFAINDPAIGQPMGRQILQLLSGLLGLLLLPLLVAAALEGLGTFRSASALPRPPRGLSGHVVLLGLGKIGARVLARLRELGIPVVCVERDPQARGVALARSLRVPTVIGDITEDGVLEAAKIADSRTLLALTSSDITNLEAVLYARGVKPDLRVVMRLYDDRFAGAVYRTLRDSHPQALTRSRSVSSLVAPAFAGAMMGRQILGAVPVERKVVLIAAVEVEGHAALQGRTAGEAFSPGAWRVLALGGPAATPRWDPPPGHVLAPGDRVIVAATREGLAELLDRRPHSRTDTSGGRTG